MEKFVNQSDKDLSADSGCELDAVRGASAFGRWFNMGNYFMRLLPAAPFVLDKVFRIDKFMCSFCGPKVCHMFMFNCPFAQQNSLK